MKITKVILIKFLINSIFSCVLINKIREIIQRGPIRNCTKNVSNPLLKRDINCMMVKKIKKLIIMFVFLSLPILKISNKLIGNIINGIKDLKLIRLFNEK